MIKVDIDMPESCADCPMCHPKGKCHPWEFACFATMEDVDVRDFDAKRLPSCPIVEVDNFGADFPLKKGAESMELNKEVLSDDFDNYTVEKNGQTEYTGVYLGSLDNLENITEGIPWHKGNDSDGITIKYSTLGEIRDFCREKYGLDIITVCVNNPLSCEIYQYGNYEPNKWDYLGKIHGYA